MRHVGHLPRSICSVISIYIFSSSARYCNNQLNHAFHCHLLLPSARPSQVNQVFISFAWKRRTGQWISRQTITLIIGLFVLRVISRSRRTGQWISRQIITLIIGLFVLRVISRSRRTGQWISRQTITLIIDLFVLRVISRSVYSVG